MALAYPAVATFAGEGEQAFVAAIRALEAGEAGCEVAAAEEGLHGGDSVVGERAEGFPVKFFVVGEEGVPAVVDDLPEERDAPATLREVRCFGFLRQWRK